MQGYAMASKIFASPKSTSRLKQVRLVISAAVDTESCPHPGIRSYETEYPPPPLIIALRARKNKRTSRRFR